MELITGLFLGAIWIMGIIFLRSITTFFHEMGHALPALLFTEKEKVNVLVGTYGNIDNCLKISFGRLDLYLKLNVFNWRIGLCTHGQIKALVPKLMVILGGPMASVLLASGALFIILSKDYSQGWLIFSVLFLISSIFDFLVNIDPSHQPIKLYDGSITYSDGYQLVQALKFRDLPDEYYQAKKLLFKQQNAQVIDIGKSLISKNKQQKPIYDLLIKAYISEKNYVQALELYDSMKAIHRFDYLDFYQIGWLNYQLDKWDTALRYFDHCIYEKHDDSNALSYRGYIRMQKGDYQKAQQDLLAATTYNSQNPIAWSNFGLLKIKTGNTATALQDLQFANQLAPDTPSIIYHLGLYYEELRNYEQALAHFKKAKALGLTYHGIDLKIADMEGFIQAFS